MKKLHKFAEMNFLQLTHGSRIKMFFNIVKKKNELTIIPLVYHMNT